MLLDLFSIKQGKLNIKHFYLALKHINIKSFKFQVKKINSGFNLWKDNFLCLYLLHLNVVIFKKNSFHTLLKLFMQS